MTVMPHRNSGRLISPTASNPPKSKEILVFLDGTGKNGQTNKDGNPTNVWKLYRLAQKTSITRSARERVTHYIPGIGSESGPLAGRWLVQVYGTEVVEQVMRAYVFISKIYQPGDDICLFGYSRGAFAARKVASLLHWLGPSKTSQDFLSKWMQREKPIPWLLADSPASKSIPVKCLGVWDTVGAVYSPIFHLKQNLLGIPDTELPANVEHAFHVLAFHENRMRFRVTLFECQDARTKLKEVWFPGSHSDVGGGGTSVIMPRISLIWMIGEMQPFLDISSASIRYPDVRLLKPSDAYHDCVWKSFVDRLETRLASHALRSKAIMHTTVKEVDEAASQVTKSSNHSLLNVLELGFLKLSLVALNQLEQEARQLSPVRVYRDLPQQRDRAMTLPLSIPTAPPSSTDLSAYAPSPRSAASCPPEWRQAIYVKDPPARQPTHAPAKQPLLH